MHELNLIYLLALICLVNCQQRVVPGINPQHYQQVPVPQQQYQHPQQPVQYQQQQQHPPQQQQQHLPPGTPPQQYQQQPPQQQQQFQQVPVQQQQQHQPPPPQQAQAHHAQHQQPQQVLNAGNIQQERAHIQEHMQVPIDTSKMSEAELQFHYFKMHDSDNNNKLDGCELIKSLIHWHVEQGSKDQHHDNEPRPHAEEKVFSDEELIALIDPILQMDDTSHDGFIDYPEFIRAQQKAAAQHQQQQQQDKKP